MNLLKLFLPSSPFKRPKLVFYIGKIKHGTPYFLPRIWRKHKTKKGYLESIPVKWFDIKLLRLGYKIKWTEWDYRFEWNPMLSIVFCHIQLCIWITSPNSYINDHYWECVLAYQKAKRTLPKGSSISEIIKFAREKHPQIWTNLDGVTTDYWDKILKTK